MPGNVPERAVILKIRHQFVPTPYRKSAQSKPVGTLHTLNTHHSEPKAPGLTPRAPFVRLSGSDARMTLATAPERGARMVGRTGATPRRCKVGRLVDGMSDARRGRFLDRLFADSSTGWTDRVLAKRLTLAGQPISAAALSIHRTGTCICAPLATTETDGQ